MDTAIAREGIRESAREVCERFSEAYWRELDAKREYPEEFVRAMTESGHLGALIPEEYGGMGLGLAGTSVILEEINRSGGNAQPAHAQVYTMGTLLRHGSEEQKWEYLPEDRQRRDPSSGLRRDRARGGDRHDLLEDDGQAKSRRRPLRRQRPQDLHLPRPALRLHDPACQHHAEGSGEAQIRAASPSSSLTWAKPLATGSQ